MSSIALNRLAKRITGIEREVRNLRTPQLAYSSVEGGGLDFNDQDGNQIVTIGPLPDGTNGQIVYSGPTPPIPAGITIEESLDGVAVRWDGTWDGDVLVAPLDFARVEIHMSTDPDFIPDVVGVPSGSLAGTFSSPRGGGVFIQLPYGSDYYFRLVARSTPGHYGEATEVAGPFTCQIVPGSRLAADAIDGKTITGALFRTAAAGRRVEIDGTGDPETVGEIHFHSGSGDETEPASIEGASYTTSRGGSTVSLHLKTGEATGGPDPSEAHLYPGGFEVLDGEMNAPSQPSLEAGRDTGQSIPDTTWENVNWQLTDAVAHNYLAPGSPTIRRGWSASGWPKDELQLDKGRRYKIDAVIAFDSDDNGQRQARLQFDTNTIGVSTWAVVDFDTQNAVGGGIPTILHLSAVIDTTYIEGPIRIQVRQNTGVPLDILGNDPLSGEPSCRLTIVQLV